MELEQARPIVNKLLKDDTKYLNLSEAAKHVKLEGRFTADELEAIALVMRSVNGEAAR